MVILSLSIETYDNKKGFITVKRKSTSSNIGFKYYHIPWRAVYKNKASEQSNIENGKAIYFLFEENYNKDNDNNFIKENILSNDKYIHITTWYKNILKINEEEKNSIISRNTERIIKKFYGIEFDEVSFVENRTQEVKKMKLNQLEYNIGLHDLIEKNKKGELYCYRDICEDFGKQKGCFFKYNCSKVHILKSEENKDAHEIIQENNQIKNVNINKKCNTLLSIIHSSGNNNNIDVEKVNDNDEVMCNDKENILDDDIIKFIREHIGKPIVDKENNMSYIIEEEEQQNKDIMDYNDKEENKNENNDIFFIASNILTSPVMKRIIKSINSFNYNFDE